MKKMILAVLVLSICYTANTQNGKQQNEKVTFGVKAGMNIANATGNGVELFTDGGSSDSKLGIAIGGFLEYGISDKFSLQPELFYSQQGFKGDANGSEATVNLDYINIPLLAKYHVSDNFSVLTGPQIGFLIASKLDSEREETELAFKSAAVETDLKDFFKSTDFGLNFGLDYQLENGFGINARYYLGISDIFDFSTSNTIDIDINSANKSTVLNTKRAGDEYVIKNGVFNVSVFYTF